MIILILMIHSKKNSLKVMIFCNLKHRRSPNRKETSNTPQINRTSTCAKFNETNGDSLQLPTIQKTELLVLKQAFKISSCESSASEHTSKSNEIFIHRKIPLKKNLFTKGQQIITT